MQLATNGIEDPSVNHFCDVGIVIKDCPRHLGMFGWDACLASPNSDPILCKNL